MLARKSSGAVERTIAERETAAAALADEIQSERAALSDVMDDGSHYERAFAAIAAKESRLAALTASLDPLRVEAMAARNREAIDDLLKRRAILSRQAAAEMKEYAKLEPHLAAVASLGARHEQTRWEVEQLNRELQEVGARNKAVGGVTYTDRERGFEDVQLATPAGLSHPNRFFHDLHVPAFRSGTHPIWAGRK